MDSGWQLQVSGDGRTLEKADGSPWFWLGDWASSVPFTWIARTSGVILRTGGQGIHGHPGGGADGV